MARGLERVASALAGVPLRLHPIALERAHVNVQRAPQRGPVDNWHQDSMPFVLITILTDHGDDPGGALLVRGASDRGGELFCKLRRPGEAILMQGSQIWHCAQQSATGPRLTVVTSFVPASLRVADTTSVRAACLYSPPGESQRQYCSHLATRVARQARRLLDTLIANNDDAAAAAAAAIPPEWAIVAAIRVEVEAMAVGAEEVSTLLHGRGAAMHADDRTGVARMVALANALALAARAPPAAPGAAAARWCERVLAAALVERVRTIESESRL